MLRKTLASFGALLMLGTAPAAVAADLIIYHNWSSPAEVAALNVLKKDFEAKGHTWTDLAIPHDSGASVSLVNLVTGGNPPNVFLEANPGVYRDLMSQGLSLDLTQWYNDNGILEHLPDAVQKVIAVDGKIVKIPTAIHIDGMVYYNLDVAQKAGVDPHAWTSLDDMFADFDKVKAAGFIPLAIGGQQWQVGYLLHALTAAVAGPEVYSNIYGTDPKIEALDSPEFRATLEMLRRFQQNTDEGSVNRDWNVTTNMVISGQALMQIHGDWMKGEWYAAGKRPGVDFGCVNIPGTKALSVTVDAWGLLGGQPEDKTKGELDFAATVLDPRVQADFALAKGSTPVRLDAPPEALDDCSKEVLNALNDVHRQVPNPHNTADEDWRTALDIVSFNFWSDPEMTVDEAIEEARGQFEAIAG
ncbi:MAG TPA: carbohydrate ABC transporter substrate-binding protein [Alphaproteobacteria bacterium]|nr:carbohydrate ABC transporter substrate-binding protein [Alphaproteobacteria bacterium]